MYTVLYVTYVSIKQREKNNIKSKWGIYFLGNQNILNSERKKKLSS